MSYSYHAFGLKIVSEIKCPELLLANGAWDQPDVMIRVGNVPTELDAPIFKRMKIDTQATANEVLLKIPNVAAYYVVNGKQITIEPCVQSDLNGIRLYLLGSCMGAIFHQRKMLPLHASAICVDDKAVLFTGKSKAGKSTTAHAFVQKGYQLHADDICVIGQKNGQTLVYPGYPHMKMWGDALDYHGLDTASFKSLQYRVNKYAVPMIHQFNQEPIPLKCIYILQKNDISNIQQYTITGMKKFIAIRNNTYRYGFIKAMKLGHIHFVQLSSALKNVPVTRIVRPTSKHTLNELTDMIEEALKG